MSHDHESTGPDASGLPAPEPQGAVAESASFHEFDAWMDMELARLVQRWIHTAAPNAQRPDFGRRRLSPKPASGN